MTDTDKIHQDHEKRITMLETEVLALKEAVKAKATGTPNAARKGGEAAPDHWLEKEFNDRAVKKDPPKWAGPSYVGRKWSACPVDYLKQLAGFLEWKAGKEAAETPVKCNDKGRPWHELTSLDAQVVRAWIARKERTEQLPGDDGGEELPF